LTNLELDWWGLDEIGEVKQETFRMLQGRLRRPGGRHKGFCVGNPAGPAHWSYDTWVILAQKHPESYRLVQATSYENTFLDEDYTLEMAKSFGEDSYYYKRFVLGQFVAAEGAFWPNFSSAPYPQGHVFRLEDVDSILRDTGIREFGKVIDFGYEHPFAILWYVTDGEQLLVLDEYTERHRTIRQHCLEIQRKDAELVEHFHFPKVRWAWADHDAQERVEYAHCVDEAGQDIGISCRPAKKNVLEGIMLVQTLFERKELLVSERCEQTIRQIPGYRAKPQEKSKKEEPIKEKDDLCDCLRMASLSELSHKMFWKTTLCPPELRYGSRSLPDKKAEVFPMSIPSEVQNAFE